MRALRTVGLGVVVFVVACGAAELFLRLVAERETMLALWFTPGVHVPEPRFGFAFRPGYVGHMRHRDGVFGVPIELDAHGLRKAQTNERTGERKRIALVGGASMMFTYGLPDHETVGARLAGASAYPAAVHTVAWPGFDPYRSWHLFRQTVGDQPWDVVVLATYQWKPANFATLPRSSDELPAPISADEWFRLVDGVAIKPSGKPFQAALGRTYYQSFLGFGVLSLADDVLVTTGIRASEGRSTEIGNGSTGRDRFASFVHHAGCSLSARGTRLLVLFMPDVDFPGDFYRELSSAVPEGVASLDLQATFVNELKPHRSIAAGHFGPEQARLIGARLARAVDGLLRAPPLRPDDDAHCRRTDANGAARSGQ